MKKAIYIFLLLFVQQSFAQNITEANALYSIEKYDEAITIYENILKQGKESSTLYYNLGNAYYKTNKIAPAILNYERALKLNPADNDIKFNLDLAKARTVDKIDAVEPFFLDTWMKSRINKASSDQWAVRSVCCFILTLALLLTYIFVRIRWIKKTAFFSACFALVMVCMFMIFAAKQKKSILNNDFGIVFSETVVIKGSPDESGTELFILHEGTKVHVKNTFGNNKEWLEVETEDGNAGWIKSENIEII
ncbi:MAG: tetratricopeptide repeat protein [Paludibacteraceae bacterium]|nr:tetratricopeptide repeat protein [Paludibacteraceae bacterium]